MPRNLAPDDRKKLVGILAEWSQGGARKGPGFYQYLVERASFPKKIELKGLGGYVGDPESDAHQLLKFAELINVNPADKNAALGSILMPLLPEAGLPDATYFAGLIVANGLISSPAALDELRARYQIPVAPAYVPAEAQEHKGPPVVWAQDTEQLALQGWFTADPVWYDVALLMTAAERARSVCRIEVATGNRGTGVLIAPDLVLTNYHVLGLTLEAPLEIVKANAAATTLRFGAFRSTGPSAAGQEVGLGPDPVLDSSPEHDYVLLRAAPAISALTDVEPFATLGPAPVKSNPVYVLQHPEGGPMKVALNANGVTWVNPNGVTLQYTTKAAKGSSGSPCFDSDWNLIALHHAGGNNKGEGMLLISIFDRIKRFRL